jgi:ssDNA-binding Zn-finger/Zn-ribbon topoisomerase 1
MTKLTNSEVWNTMQPMHLTAIDKQRRFVMTQHLQRKPCPNCGELHNVPEAAGKSIDDYDFEGSTNDRIGPCSKCGRTLIYTLPFQGVWHWRLDYEEAQPKSVT